MKVFTNESVLEMCWKFAGNLLVPIDVQCLQIGASDFCANNKKVTVSTYHATIAQ